MSVLAALARAYDRIPGLPAQGFSAEKIGFCIILRSDGSVAAVDDLRSADRKPQPRIVQVPQAVKRASGIAPNFLWDKTSYVLGVTSALIPVPEDEDAEEARLRERKIDKAQRRLLETHDAFKELHLSALADTDDPGLQALLGFLGSWRPEDFTPPLWPDEIRDQNVVFALESEYRDGYLHDRPAAKAAWRAMSAQKAPKGSQICLVSGEAGATARLHPSIKGVWDAQSSGASLVSFNIDAAESYGHSQGDNAPVSAAAVFQYGTVLNLFLKKGSGHVLQIGDMSTVFWADAAGIKAEAAESLFARYVEGPAGDDRIETARIGSWLERLRRGDPLADVVPELAQGVRFYILGLAPNAARLSVRLYLEDDFGTLIRNFQRHLQDMAVEPGPRQGWPGIWMYLTELAVLKKRENVPRNLAGA